MTDRKLVVFDFDGTLADYRQVGETLLAEFSIQRGLPYDAEKVYAGYVDPLRYDLGWGVSLAEQPALFRELENYSTEQTIVHKKFIAPLFDYAMEALQKLQDMDYDLSVVTARDRATFLAGMNYTGIADYFNIYRSSCCMRDRGKAIKPAPDAIHCLLEESGHRPENTVMVGDTTADINMANHAGIKSIAVLWGLHSAERLAAANPTVMLEEIKGLPDAVSKVFNRDNYEAHTTNRL